MQQSCFSHNGRLLAWRYYIFGLALSRAALIGVGSRGGFYSLSFIDVYVMFGIYPFHFLECDCPSYTRSAISVRSNMAQV